MDKNNINYVPYVKAHAHFYDYIEDFPGCP